MCGQIAQRNSNLILLWQKKIVPPLKRVPGYPLCPVVGSSAPGPRLSPDSLQQKSVSADHSRIAPARIRIIN